jgi:DNA repair protein RadC
MFLDNQHQLISIVDMFTGTIDSASVYPREVVKQALTLNAAAVVLIHNHPSGEATPSNADKQMTNRLKDALELVGTRVLDHIIIGGACSVSFAEQGLI